MAMSIFRKYLQALETTEEERQQFVKDCANWTQYCLAVTRYDKTQLLKLIKYLKSDRPTSKTFLKRAIARFNRANALKLSDLD